MVVERRTQRRPAVARLLALVLLAASTAIPATADAQRYHTVRKGQTLSAIAKRHRIAVWDLALANGLTPKSRLKIGRSLEVPPRGVTYMRRGQTLSHIARARDCSVAELKRLNRIRKGDRVRAGRRLILPGFLSVTAQDKDWGKPEVAGRVKLRRRDGQHVLQLDDGQGRVRLKGVRQLARLMRRHDDDDVQSVHPRLALLIARISDHFGGREVKLVSGFREAGGYTRESSRHLAGRAADIQVRGVPRRLVWEYCKTLAQTGCGFYPRSVFVHVDVRERHGQWVDWSRPGKRPRYGTLRGPWRKRQRKDPNRPRETRRITRADAVPLIVEVVDRHDSVVNRFDDQRAPTEPETPDAQEDEALAAGDETTRDADARGHDGGNPGDGQGDPGDGQGDPGEESGADGAPDPSASPTPDPEPAAEPRSGA